jgi:hypothetical protein
MPNSEFRIQTAERCARLSLFWILASGFCVLSGQTTKTDLARQATDADFTLFPSTKPFSMGVSLPVSCNTGQMFFWETQPAGQNVYGCTATNSWSLEGGTSSSGGGVWGAIMGTLSNQTDLAAALGTKPTCGLVTTVGNPGANTNCPTEAAVRAALGGVLGQLTVQVSGGPIGTHTTLNFISGTGIIQSCANNSGASRVDCTPALDTSYALSRPTDQAGTDKSLIASSGGAGGTFVAAGSPTFTTYTQNQTLSFLASDSACAAGATLNIDGLGPIPLKKVIAGALVAIESGDCVQGVPTVLTGYGSPVTALLLTPPEVGWVSNVTAQSTSQSTVTLASAPSPGAYRIVYYLNQNGLCSTGSNTVGVTFGWTDGAGARTLITGSLTLGIAQSTASYLTGLPTIYVGSGNVTYSSTVAGACATGTSSYDIHVSMERLQ